MESANKQQSRPIQNGGSSPRKDDRMLEIEINSQITASDSEDCDIYDSDGDVSLLKFNKIFNNPKRNDFELVNTFNLLEVTALAVQFRT